MHILSTCTPELSCPPCLPRSSREVAWTVVHKRPPKGKVYLKRCIGNDGFYTPPRRLMPW